MKPARDPMLFPYQKHWDTPSRHCHSNDLQKWAIEQAESVADKGKVHLSCVDNWWKLQCMVAGVPFSTTSQSLRKCVQGLFSFVTRGCQYVEIAQPPPLKSKQQRIL